MNAETSSPFVSVVITTYNQQDTIKRAVDSVLAQVFDKDIEIIIAEDCSTDNTKKVCQEIAKNNPQKIRLLLQSENKGVMRNYFDALKMCKGKYICSFAGDDYWIDCKKIEKQVDYLEKNPSIGLVYTDFDQDDEINNIKSSNCFESGLVPRVTSFEEELKTRSYLACLTWMFRAELSPEKIIKDKFYVDESFAYILDMYKVSEVGYIPEATAMRIIHSDSLSYQTNYSKRLKQEIGVFQIQKDYIEKYRVPESIVGLIYSDTYFRLYGLAMNAGDDAFLKEAEDYFENRHISIVFFKQLWNNYNKLYSYYMKISWIMRLSIVRRIRKSFA